MNGDTMTTKSWYRRGYNDAIDGPIELTANMTENDIDQYRQGVEDARNGGHICTMRMQPRKEINDAK